MTILFVSHYSGYYGAAKSMLALILDLRERYGVKPLVLLPTYGVLCKELDKNKVPYIVSHYYWWVNYNKGLFQLLLNKRKQLLNIFNVNKIYKQIRERNIDLVYSNSVTVNVGMLLAERLNRPHIWQFRESLTQFNLSLSLSLSLSLLKSKVNKKFILISDYMVDFYKKYLPMDRVVRIYNGVRLPDITEENNLTQNGELHLVMVGVVCEQKNNFDAINAINCLKIRGYNNVILHLLGVKTDDYVEKLRQYIKKNDLQNQVVFHGHCDEVYGFLTKMNVGLMCSRDEAFGRVTVEYMAFGLPVIASLSGANAELVEDGENGFVYPIYDYESLADKIELFIKNPVLLQQLGKNASITARNFTIEKNTDSIYKIIKDIVENE